MRFLPCAAGVVQYVERNAQPRGDGAVEGTRHNRKAAQFGRLLARIFSQGGFSGGWFAGPGLAVPEWCQRIPSAGV